MSWLASPVGPWFPVVFPVLLLLMGVALLFARSSPVRGQIALLVEYMGWTIDPSVAARMFSTVCAVLGLSAIAMSAAMLYSQVSGRA